jgi:hypothetical protein
MMGWPAQPTAEPRKASTIHGERDAKSKREYGKYGNNGTYGKEEQIF